MAAQTSSRKQWNISRGPRGKVHSLVWTECGCPDQQVNLAKQLLVDNGEKGVDKDEKARLAVYWLTKASEKGHEEATQMLQECMENETGITEHNISDVKVCLEMSRGEKLSREAAKELFLSLSQGEHFITLFQLRNEMAKYSEDHLPSWSILKEESGERITEESLIAAASTHCNGELPSLLRNRSVLGWSRLPIAVTGFGSTSIVSHIFIALAAIAYLGFDVFFNALPMFLYYGSLILMVITTCQVIVRKWDFADFQRWSNLLLIYGCHEKTSEEAQWSHCIMNIMPCFIFALCLVTNLLFLPNISDAPLSEITILSSFMSLFCLYNLATYKNKSDFLSILVFIIHLLARYPYDRETMVSQYWRNLDGIVPKLSSYVLGVANVLGSGVEFHLNFSVLFYLMLPGLFLKMALRDQRLGIFTTLIPHLVCLSWWQFAITVSKDSTYVGLIRSCLVLLCIIVFLPMVNVIFLLIPLATITKFFIEKTVSLPVAIGGILSSLIFYLCTKLKKWGNLFYYLLVLLSVTSVFLNVNYETETVHQKQLEWKEYEISCARSELHSQEVCLSLSGQHVNWEGKILSSGIASVRNPVSSFINRLPDILQELLICTIGEKINDCEEASGCNSSSSLSLKRCHLSNWNRYEYEFKVDLGYKSTSEEGRILRLKGGNEYQNYSSSLKSGDSVRFSGILISDLQNLQQPLVLLKSLECISCSRSDNQEDSDSNNILAVLNPLVNFLLYPLNELR